MYLYVAQGQIKLRMYRLSVTKFSSNSEPTEVVKLMQVWDNNFCVKSMAITTILPIQWSEANLALPVIILSGSSENYVCYFA